jgi:NAD-dependent histone deacetylase SIR2
VQAFLDAADEVDIDEETAMDILQGFDGDLHIGEDDEVNVEVDGEPNTSTEINELDENWESEDDGASSEHDMHEEEGKNIVVLMAAKCMCICIHGVCGGHALCRI